MKYWIFQNNQVLGPYEPDDLSKISAFSPESLVCSEGRRGTNMGDWQRAGMVPDLSVALVRAGSSGGKTATLSITGLPPEPTLQDFAALESVRQKVATLENVVQTLQESLRGKDAELSAVHGESETLKRQLAGLEERLASVRLLGETLDKAVTEEKRVEHDVEKQGQTLSELAHEVETLRCRLEGRAAPAPATAAAPAVPVETVSAPFPSTTVPVSAVPTLQPPPPAIADFPTGALVSAGFEPISFGGPVVAPTPAPAPDPAPEPEPIGAQIQELSPAPAAVGAAAAPAKTSGKKTLILGAALGVGALAALAVVGGYVPGVLAPRAPEILLESAPTEPAPAPEPAPDPRALAVDLAKAWPLRGGRTLGGTLETLAPPGGNLSPWMAETLVGGRVQVNYFARSAAADAPTIAYEFEVDLEGKTLVGRNAAAKSVLTGKAAAPPAPPRAKPVRVKPKKAAAPKAKAPEEDTLDSLLGEPAGASTPAQAPATETTPPANSKAERTLALPGWDGGDASVTEPGAADEPAVRLLGPTDAEKPRPRPSRRAAKAKGGESAADESLLDDLLME